MPVYAYHCPNCSLDFDVTKKMSLSDRAEPCPECQGETKKSVVQTSFILRGDDWAGKANKIAGQMRKKNERLTVKQAEQKRDAPGMTLVPNVDGERVDSWKEAGKLARAKGKSTTGYEQMATKEARAKK